jgi:hypothetical protein
MSLPCAYVDVASLRWTMEQILGNDIQLRWLARTQLRSNVTLVRYATGDTGSPQGLFRLASQGRPFPWFGRDRSSNLSRESRVGPLALERKCEKS